MNVWEITVVSCGVSLDLFAVALAIGLLTPHVTWPMVGRFTPLLTIPSLATLLAGQQFAAHVLLGCQAAEQLLTPLVLGWIGCAMLAGQKGAACDSATLGTWPTLLGLGCVASLDVGLAGMAMGTQGGSAVAAFVIVPACTALAVLAGLSLGCRLSRPAGRYAEVTGGGLLVAMAEYICFG